MNMSLCRRFCKHTKLLTSQHAARVDTSVPRRHLASSSQLDQGKPTAATAAQSKGRDDASLARYPNLRSPGGILRGLDYAGTLTFALTGAVTAAQSGLDVFGSTMAAVITVVGGGTIRDAIFLNRKPFWMGAAMGLCTFFLWPEVLEWQKEHKAKKKKMEQITEQSDTSRNINEQESYDELDGALDTLDAIGLSSFAIIGAQNGVRAGMPMIVSAICGMATSTFGGLTRDVLCGRPIRIVHSNAEVYAEPALAGATTYLIADKMGGRPALKIFLAMAVCIGSRFVAVKNDVKVRYVCIYATCSALKYSFTLLIFFFFWRLYCLAASHLGYGPRQSWRGRKEEANCQKESKC
jgi:uncharacterized membrane protein YeiH